MAYPITGELGKVNSVTASTDLNQLLMVACKIRQISYQVNAPTHDITGYGETAAKHAVGICNHGFTFEGIYPKTAPRVGNTGLVTLSAGTVYKVKSWSLDFDFGEHEITGFESAGVTFSLFRPGAYPQVTGTYVSHVPNDAAITTVAAVNGSAASATFKLTEDGASDPGFTADVFARRVGQTVGGPDVVEASYEFVCTGTVTSVAGSTLPAILPAGAVDASDWGDGTTGPTTLQVVTQSVTGRTYTSHYFLRRLSIVVSPGEVIRVSGECRGISALTLA
jgi:hypothetical protein